MASIGSASHASWRLPLEQPDPSDAFATSGAGPCATGSGAAGAGGVTVPASGSGAGVPASGVDGGGCGPQGRSARTSAIVFPTMKPSRYATEGAPSDPYTAVPFGQRRPGSP